MRRLFPASILTGWKYELDGTADEVMAKGRRQIDDCLTDACVLNGRAYGSGFGFLSRSGEQVHLPNKAALCRFLIDWAERTPMALAAPGQQSFHALSSFTARSRPSFEAAAANGRRSVFPLNCTAAQRAAAGNKPPGLILSRCLRRVIERGRTTMDLRWIEKA